MKIRPLRNWVMLKRLEQDEKSVGGIIIPDTAKEKPQRGLVTAVGPGKRNEDGVVTPVDVQVGDKVLFSKFAGTEIKLAGEELLILQEDDIVGVIEN